MGLECPRCGAQVSRSQQTITIAEKALTLDKFTCFSCNTKFYFEEDIAAYVVAVADIAKATKGV